MSRHGLLLVNPGDRVAFNTGGLLQFDLDGNGLFEAAHDFQITLIGVTTITYNATVDLFLLS